MFLCTHEARVQYPASLLPPGGAYFGIVFKELKSPWFIVTFDVNTGGETITQTALIADVERLIEILESDEIAKIHSVNCMTNDDTTRGWVYRVLDEVLYEQSSGQLVIHEVDKNALFVTTFGVKLVEPGLILKNWTWMFGTKSQDE